MKRLLFIILLFAGFTSFSQTEVMRAARDVLTSGNSDSLGGFPPAYYLDTTDIFSSGIWVDTGRTDTYDEKGTFREPYKTIRQAVDSVTSGGKIFVFEGTYRGDFIIDNLNNVSIIAVGDREKTIIQFESVLGLELKNGSSNFLLQGFNLKSGTGSTFLIQITGASNYTRIYNNIIDTRGNATMGISTSTNGNDSLLIKGNKFILDSGDGGLYGVDFTNLVVDNNVTIGDDSTSGYAYQMAGCQGGWFRGNTITAVASGVFPHGIGASTDSSSNIVISNNEIYACGRAIRLGHSTQTHEVDSVRIFGNKLYSNSVGVFVDVDATINDTTFYISGNEFQSNITDIQNQNATDAIKYGFNTFDQNSTNGGNVIITAGDLLTGTASTYDIGSDASRWDSAYIDNVMVSNDIITQAATQDYKISGATGSMTISGQGAGSGTFLSFQTSDADGTDDCYFQAWAVGKASASVNRERLFLGYESSTTQFEIQSEANGTGTLRPIVLFIEGNADQLKAEIDGDVLIGAGDLLNGSAENYNVVDISVNLTVTGEVTLSGVLLAGYAIDNIIFKNTTANQITNLDIGFSDAGGEVVAAANLLASDEGSFTILQKIDDFDAADDLYISADAWNGASLIIYIRMVKYF